MRQQRATGIVVAMSSGILLFSPPLSVVRAINTLLTARNGGCGCSSEERGQVSFDLWDVATKVNYWWPYYVFSQESDTSLTLGDSHNPWGRYEPRFQISGFCDGCRDWLLDVLRKALPGYVCRHWQPNPLTDAANDTAIALTVSVQTLADLVYLNWAFEVAVEHRHDDYWNNSPAYLALSPEVRDALQETLPALLRRMGFDAPDDSPEQWSKYLDDIYYIVDHNSDFGSLADLAEEEYESLCYRRCESHTRVAYVVGDAESWFPLAHGCAVKPAGHVWSEQVGGMDLEQVEHILQRIPSVATGKQTLSRCPDVGKYANFMGSNEFDGLVAATYTYPNLPGAELNREVLESSRQGKHSLLVKGLPRKSQFDFESASGCYPSFPVTAAARDRTNKCDGAREVGAGYPKTPAAQTEWNFPDSTDRVQDTDDSVDLEVLCANKGYADYLSSVLDRAAPALQPPPSDVLSAELDEDQAAEDFYDLYVDISSMAELDILNVLRDVPGPCLRSCDSNWGSVWQVHTKKSEVVSADGRIRGVFERHGHETAVAASLVSQCRTCFLQLQARVETAFPEHTWRIADRWPAQIAPEVTRRVRVYTDDSHSMSALFDHFAHHRETHYLRSWVEALSVGPANGQVLLCQSGINALCAFTQEVLTLAGIAHQETDLESGLWWRELSRITSRDDYKVPASGDLPEGLDDICSTTVDLMYEYYDRDSGEWVTSSDCYSLTPHAPIAELADGDLLTGRGLCFDLPVGGLAKDEVEHIIMTAAKPKHPREGEKQVELHFKSPGERYFSVAPGILKSIADWARDNQHLSGALYLAQLGQELGKSDCTLFVVNPGEETSEQLRAITSVWSDSRWSEHTSAPTLSQTPPPGAVTFCVRRNSIVDELSIVEEVTPSQPGLVVWCVDDNDRHRVIAELKAVHHLLEGSPSHP